MYMEPHHSSTSNNSLATGPPAVPPGLPLELERLIFELAALDIGPNGSTTLLLVAKRVHNWCCLYTPSTALSKKDMNSNSVG